jgi:hypothetical protein
MQLAARSVVEENERLRGLLEGCVCGVGREWRVEGQREGERGEDGMAGKERGPRGEVGGVVANGPFERMAPLRVLGGVAEARKAEAVDDGRGRRVDQRGRAGMEVFDERERRAAACGRPQGVVEVSMHRPHVRQESVTSQGIAGTPRGCEDIPGCCQDETSGSRMVVEPGESTIKDNKCQGFGKEGCCADEETDGDRLGRRDSASTSLETSCEEAVMILRELQKGRHVDSSQVRAALGCESGETCMVKNTRLFQVMDEL